MSYQSRVPSPASPATKDRVARFTESRDLLDDALVPTALVLEPQAFDRLVELLERPPAPTDALRELMRKDSR